MKTKALVLFLMLYVLKSSGATYYVNDASQTGDIYTTGTGNNANAGTAARPWATLAHALTVAVANDTVFIDAGVYSDNNLSVNQANLNIIGAGSTLTIFNNNFASANTNYLLKVFANGVKISGILAIKYNTTNVGEGRAVTISNATGVVLTDVAFTNNDGSGGGNASLMIVSNSSVTIKGSSFACNPASGATNDYGGGIDIIGQRIRVTIDSSVMSNNGRTSWYGGGVYISGDSSTVVTITNCAVSGNAALDGGAVYSTILSGLSSSTPGPVVTIRNSCFTGNSSQDVSAFSYGGAITVFSGKLSVYNCSFTSNSGGVGGAIAANSNDGAITLVVDSCSFSSNTTTQSNAGYDIYARVAFSHVTTVTCLQNTFSAAASSIVNANSATVSVSNSGNPGTTGSGGTVSFINTIPPAWTTVTNCPSGAGSCVCTVPVINSPAPPSTICSGSVFSTALTSSTASVYTTYSWTSPAVAGITGHATSGTGNVSETLTNTTGSPLTVTYTITPRFNNLCNGTPVVYSVTVTPKPVMTSATTATVCSGVALNFTLTASLSSTFNWIAANNANTTGESITQQSSSVINDVITNTTAGNQIVVYTVTPVSVSGTCAGNSQTVNVTVNPAPVMTSANSLSVCSGNPINLSLTSNVASTYAWVATSNVNTTGQDTTLQAGATIKDTIYNITATAQIVTYTVTPVSVTGSCSGAAQLVAVTVNPLPQVTINPTDSLTCAVTTITLTAIPSFGSVNYNWSGGGTASTKTVSAPGTYTVTVTSTPGNCTASSSVNVNQNITVPNVSIGFPDTLNCIVYRVVLNASSTTPGVTYSWNGGSTSSANLASTPGVYSVTVTNPANGCTASASVTVAQNITAPNVSLAPADTLTCAVTSVQLNAGSTTAGVSYAWSNGFNTASQTVTTPALYIVTVTNTDNGCTSTASANVSQNTVSPNLGVAPPATLNCLVTSSALTASSTTAGATFAWSAGSLTNTETVNAPGSYSVTVTNPTNGCKVSATISVTQNITTPNLSVTPNTALTCSVISVTVTASSTTPNATYAWNNGVTSSSFVTDTAATYVITVTDPANGCTASATTAITQNSGLPNVTIARPDTITCLETSVVLSTSSNTGGVTYSWSNGATTSSVTVSSAGVYAVTITNPINGCRATAGTNVVQGTISAPSSVSASASANPVCIGPSVNLTASGTGAASWHWAGPNGYSANTQNISINNFQSTNAGQYTVAATNICGITSTSVTLAADSIPTGVAASVNTALACFGSAINFTGTAVNATSFSWTGPAGFSSTIQSPSIAHATVSATGNYVFTATNVCGNLQRSVTLTIDTTIILTGAYVGPSDTLCTGSDIQLTANGSNVNTWAWTGPANFTSSQQNITIHGASVLNSGAYVLAVTNACGSLKDTVNVWVENSTLSLTAGSSALNDSACAGQTINLFAAGSNFDTYNWTGPAGFVSTLQNPVITNAGANFTGNYIITAANNCGTLKDTVHLQINSAPTLPAISTTTGGNTFCQGQNVVLNASAANVNNLHWSLPGGATSTADSILLNNIQPAQQGYYYVTAENVCGSKTDSLLVTVFVLPGNLLVQFNHDSICPGTSVTLATTPGLNNIMWNTQSTADSFITTQGGTYYYSARDLNGCLQFSDTINVVAVNGPVLDLFSSAPVSVCQGQQQITLKATSDVASIVTWYPGGVQADSIQVSSAGTYVVVASKNGCNVSDSVSIALATIPAITFADSNITTCCADVTLAPVVAGTANTYLWSDGSTAATDLLTASGLYTLTVTSIKGCSATSSVNFNKVCIQARAAASPDTIQIESSSQLSVQSLLSTNIYYNWLPADNLQGGTTSNPVASPKSTTTYTVFVNDSVSGCRDSSSVTVVVLYAANFGVPNVFTPNNDGNNDTWYIINQGGLVTVQNIVIFDRWGIEVFSSQREGTIEWDGKYEGKLQPMGNYVYDVALKINATGEEKHLHGNLTLLW